ncbi:MAG: methyltransferase domain-containing protein [Sphingobacteriales bacterium]
MKVIDYIRYFFYLAWNWNPLLACFIIYHEIRGEKKYKLHTTGYDELNKLASEGIDVSHATMYMPANYYLLEKMLNYVKSIPGNECLLDIGCGKGRVLIVAAHYGFRNLIGVEFSKKFCAETNAIILSKEKEFPLTSFSVINQDASSFVIPDNTTTIFLYNPFDEVIMNNVVLHVEESLKRRPRNLLIIYINPQGKHLFINNGFKEIFHAKKLKYLEGVILEKKPG